MEKHIQLWASAESWFPSSHGLFTEINLTGLSRTVMWLEYQNIFTVAEVHLHTEKIVQKPFHLLETANNYKETAGNSLN